MALGISELSVDGENLTIIEFDIFLTWQPVFMISQVWPRLELHLRISSLAKVVIFLYITGFRRCRFLPVISINLYFRDI
jgi:hypothetical protein